ncbi:MAG: hypothetical protein Kow006_22530 [Gammaproteobacteria bacterium]
MQEKVAGIAVEERNLELALLQKGLFDLINRYTFDNCTALAPLIIRYLALLVEHPEVTANPLLRLGYLELELHWHLQISRETRQTIRDVRITGQPSSVLEGIHHQTASENTHFELKNAGVGNQRAPAK